MLQVLRSAQANAVNNHGLDGSRLRVGALAISPVLHAHILASHRSEAVPFFSGLKTVGLGLHILVHDGQRAFLMGSLTLRMHVISSKVRDHQQVSYADLVHVGTGTPKKIVWPHGRGRSGIRRKYKSHLTVCP